MRSRSQGGRRHRPPHLSESTALPASSVFVEAEGLADAKPSMASSRPGLEQVAQLRIAGIGGLALEPWALAHRRSSKSAGATSQTGAVTSQKPARCRSRPRRSFQGTSPAEPANIDLGRSILESFHPKRPCRCSTK
jgi:hypothetical protein